MPSCFVVVATTLSVFALVSCQTTLRATFNMKSIVGDVFFVQTAASGTVSLTLNLSGVTAAMEWAVRQFPTNYDLKLRCPDSDVGVLFDGLDLGAKHGRVHTTNQTSTAITDDRIRLSGPQSIAGRSLVLINRVNGERVCASIRTETTMYSAFARFPAKIGGTVWFRQPANQPGSDTTVYADLFFIDGTMRDVTLPWAILSGKVMAEVKTMAMSKRCESLGSVYNPNGQSGTGCARTNHASCSVGEMVDKHGPVDVAMHKGAMKMFYTDTNLPLTGPSSIVDKSIVIYNEERTKIIACTNINEISPKNISVNFDMDGVEGTIGFAQPSPFEATTVSVDLRNLQSNAKSYHVHVLPVPRRPSSDYALCGPSAVLGHWNPFGVDVNNNQGPGMDTNDAYEIGDLSGKYGLLSGMTQKKAVYTDWNLPLFGQNSIVGRSLVIHKNDNGRWVCGDIPYPAGPIRTATVTFKYPVIGQIVLRQAKNNHLSDTTVQVNLAYGDGTKMTTGHNFHIHVKPVGADFLADSGRCAECEGHFNPFEVDLKMNYTSQCSPENPLRCECGDLSGKHGPMTVGTAKPGFVWNKAFYTDVELPLSGPMSLVDRSVVIHAKDRGAARISCANIVEERTVVATLSQWTSNVTGMVKLMQQFDHTWLTASIDRLGQKAGGYHIHNLPVPDGLSSPCSQQAVSGHFNPYNVNVAGSPAAGSGTKDQYEVGDLSGKYGTMDGMSKMALDVFDNNLPLRGPNSVVGRSIVIHKSGSGSRWTCGNIVPDTTAMGGTLVTAVATFRGEIAGKVFFKQVVFADGSHGDTTILMDVYYNGNKNKKTLNHNWHIHVTPAEGDQQVSAGRCGSCGPHYNPYRANVKVGYHGCNRMNPLRCELGDTSGKQGKYDIGGGRKLYTDIDTPLTGNFSVIGRSIVFHVESAGAPRLACTDIMPEKSERVKLYFPKMTGFKKSAVVRQISAALNTQTWNVVSEDADTEYGCSEALVHLVGDTSSELKEKLDVILASADASVLGKFAPSSECRPPKQTSKGHKGSMALPYLVILLPLIGHWMLSS